MSLPEPLTPADSDLQDFPFMPLHVARLRDSDLAAEEPPEACWYAVLLWAASWHQLPAGSLPDNDTVLMRLCGLGRDTRTWKKHRDGALRGFVKCSDGRLYHPVVAEQVVAAWESKRQQRWRTECARIKKANQRNGTDNPTPTFEEFVAGDTPVRVPDVSLGTVENGPEDNGSKGQGERQGQGQGQGDNKDIGDAAPPPTADSAPAKRGSRLSTDFVMPEEWKDWARSERRWANADIEAEAAGFVDYWHAKPGKDGTKLNWEATWRNWVRNSRRPNGTANGGGKPLSRSEQIASFERHAATAESVGRSDEAEEFRKQAAALRTGSGPARSIGSLVHGVAAQVAAQ